MVVGKETLTTEEKASEQKDVKAKSDDLMDGILKTMDLPEGEEPEEEDEKKKTPEGEEVDEEEAEESEEEETEESEEEDEEVEEDEEEDGEVKDDLIPKSDLDKLQRKFENRLKSQADKIRKLEARATTNKSVDKDQEKLDGMSEKELRTLKREVRMAQIKANEDDAKVAELLDLEDKIENTLRDAPRKLLTRQVELYDERAAEIMSENDDMSDESVKFIKNKAAEIYQSDKVYQRSENGQKLALDLAYQHFVEIKKAANKSNKNGNKELKRRVNSLKKKTALSTSSLKGGKKIGKRLKRLREKAVGGTLFDKENLVRNDPRFNVDAMIPDELTDKE